MKLPHALVQDGLVVDVVDADHPVPMFDRFHPTLVAIACSPEVKHGWAYKEGQFIPPPAPPPPLFPMAGVSNQDLQDQIAELRRQLAELKQPAG